MPHPTPALRPVRHGLIFCVSSAVVFFAALAAAGRADAQLATIETPQVRLVYFEGSESYLVPHSARAFLNALEFEQKLFKFTLVRSASRCCWRISRTPATRQPRRCRAT